MTPKTPFGEAKDGPVEVVAYLTRSQHKRVVVTLDQGATWQDYLDAVVKAAEEGEWDTEKAMIRHHTVNGNLPDTPYPPKEKKA